MAGGRLDLSRLDAVDLQALRLGAQVMVHKAELAARPRVELFFRGLQLTVDEEMGRRRRASEEGPLAPHVSPPHATPPLASPGDVAGAVSANAAAGATTAGAPTAGLSPGAADDRRLTAEYLDLLAANPRLSPVVRATCRTLREGLRPDA